MQKKWTDEVKGLLETLYNTPKTRPGHEPAGIKPKITAKNQSERNDQDEGVAKAWVSGTRTV